MIIKLHRKGDRVVAAVCDSEILGKKFEEGKLQLDMTSDFFKGDEKEEGVIGDMIRNADSANLVGEKAVNLGIKEGIIEEGHVKKIAGIPYAQAVIVRE